MSRKALSRLTCWLALAVGTVVLVLARIGWNGSDAGSRPAPRLSFSGKEIVQVLAPSAQPETSPPGGEGARKAAPQEVFGNLPLTFEANLGQTAPEVAYLARGTDYTLFLTPEETVLAFGKDEKRKTNDTPNSLLRLRLLGGNPRPKTLGESLQPEVRHYLIGDDSRRWRRNVPTYGKVRYAEVYPGIDAVYYGNEQRLEYDFIVAPGADPRLIRLQFAGASRLSVNRAGDLVVSLPDGKLVQHKPIVHQERDGVREFIDCRYQVVRSDEVAFNVEKYDPTRPLVIDPVLSYSTYLGGGNTDRGYRIAVDSSGNAYLTGTTRSTNFPLQGALQAANGGDFDVFVSKLNPTGTGLVYSTYLGGTGTDQAAGLTVDADGNAYVTGCTSSTNFPTATPLQAASGGGLDAFILKLNPTGDSLAFSTYLGGSGNEQGNALAVGAGREVFVTGYTESSDFPKVQPVQAAYGGGRDAFVLKLNPTGSGAAYVTYLGGSGAEVGYGVAADASGNAYVAGGTASTNFPTAGAIQATYGGGTGYFGDAFVTRVTADGATFDFSTYLGGTSEDVALGIAVDAQGRPAVAGFTQSSNFPKAAALQASLSGSFDAFAAKLQPASPAWQFVFSTYLGGAGSDQSTDMTVDGDGNVVLTGWTDSANFPQAKSLQATTAGGRDAFLTKIKTDGSGLIESMYLGGAGSDRGESVAVDGAGNAYLTGSTKSTNFRTLNPFQATTGGGEDAFVTRIGACAIPLAPPALPNAFPAIAYSQTLTPSGGTPPYTFSLQSGSLPSGMTLSAAGVISGTPPSATTSNFTVKVVDGAGCVDAQAFTLQVANCSTSTVSPASLPSATVGVPYGQTITASGGASPYTFGIVAGFGNLPTGLTLNAAGDITGTPTAAGNFGFRVRATDANGCFADKTYSIAVSCSTVTIAPASLPGATVGVAYAQTVTASGNTSPVAFSIVAGLGTLPTGLTMDAVGNITGTPTAAGNFGFRVRATDANNCVTDKAYSIAVSCSTVTIAPASLPGATVGVAYAQTVTASGNTSPVAFSIVAGFGTLPTGLTMDAAGAITGTPTAAGNFGFRVRATDANNCVTDKTYSIAVSCPTVTIAPASLPSGNVGVPYTQTVTASGNTSPVAFSIVAGFGTLPTGLTMDAAGAITGTPTAAGNFGFRVRATDANGCFTDKTYSVTVTACPTITVSPASLPNGAVGTAYNQTLTASGGTAPYTFTVTAGTLPPGLALATTGALAGTPTTAGSFTFTASASMSNGCRGNRSYTIDIACTSAIALQPETLPNGLVGAAYARTLTASGGAAPYSFQISSGALPDGLTLSPAGQLSGTPTASGSFTFTVRATDAAGCSGTKSHTVVIAACPTISVQPETLPNGLQGVAYSQTLTASGGQAPHTFLVTQGAPPAGVTLSNSGTLAGMPTASGSFTFTVTATDATGCAGTRTYTFTVGTCPSVTIAPNSLPNAFQGVAYAQTLSVEGGSGTYGFALSSGALPDGLTLSNAGAFAGTPTASGSFTFSVTATATDGCATTRSYTLTVGTCPEISLLPTTLPDATQGVAYDQTISVNGGGSPTFALISGTVPNGLTLSNAGALAGTPTETGNFTFTIKATNETGCTGQRDYTLVVNAPCPTISLSATLADGFTGVAYNRTISASGGAAPHTFAVASGTIPPGLNLAASGTLSGTPPTTGSFTFTVRATDANGCAGEKPYTVTIADCPTITISPATLAAGTVGTPYIQNLTASGGVPAHILGLASGTVPPGLALSPAGQLLGTPTAGGSFPFVVRAIDANGCFGEAAFTITISTPCPTVSVTPDALPSGTHGTVYSQTLTASGGASPYGFILSAGTLPAGLTLSPTGELAGTPTETGNFAFTVRATDAQGCAGEKAYSLTIAAACPAIGLTPGALPNALQNIAYSQTLTASGGATPYTFQVVNGALPAGLTLSGAGAISGAATASGSFTFTVRATDASGCSGDQAYTLTVGTCPTITLAPDTLPNATQGLAYSRTITASGGQAPHTFQVVNGTLPAGLGLSPTGTISGTPSTSGSFTFTVRATDSRGCTGEKAYTLTVGTCPTMTFTPPTLPNAIQNLGYTQTLTVSGGTSPYLFTLSAGSLPEGLNLGSAGTISGAPTAAGSFTFTVTTTDSIGCQGTQSFTLTVGTCPTISITPTTLPAGEKNAAYNQTLTASGGAAAHTFAVASGALPSGLTLNANGQLAGTPSVVGSFTFIVRATDAQGCTGQREYTLEIGCAGGAVTVQPATLANGLRGVAYSQNLTAQGGTLPHSFTVASGLLPAGLTLATNGTLAGTPTTLGSFTFIVRATDAAGCFAEKGYTVTVADCPTITISPEGLPAGTQGTPYNQTVTASGGGPFTFTLASGTLPAGLALNSNGTLSGTPTDGGTFNFVVRATAASGCSGEKAYTLTVAGTCGTITVMPTTLPVGTVGDFLTQAFTASGGATPYVFTVSAGALPAGLTLSPQGVLSGTLLTAGNFSFTITATDAQGCAGGVSFTSVRVGNVGVRHAPTVNGRIEGTLRLLTGEDVTLNGGAVVTGDLMVPGTPSLRLNGNPSFGGTILGPGASAPTNYQITLNGNATLGRLVKRIDPIPLPSVAAPPAPTGTRDVTINSPSGQIGDPTTLRNLTLNGNVGVFAVPPGTYGNFTANGGSGFVLGIPGATQPAVYNLQNLTLNGTAELRVVGPVILVLQNGTSFNGQAGSTTDPAWLTVKVFIGGVTLNGGSALYGNIIAPNGTVIVNGNSRLVGGLSCDRLIVNGGGLVKPQP